MRYLVNNILKNIGMIFGNYLEKRNYEIFLVINIYEKLSLCEDCVLACTNENGALILCFKKMILKAQ